MSRFIKNKKLTPEAQPEKIVGGGKRLAFFNGDDEDEDLGEETTKGDTIRTFRPVAPKIGKGKPKEEAEVFTGRFGTADKKPTPEKKHDSEIVGFIRAVSEAMKTMEKNNTEAFKGIVSTLKDITEVLQQQGSILSEILPPSKGENEANEDIVSFVGNWDASFKEDKPKIIVIAQENENIPDHFGDIPVKTFTTLQELFENVDDTQEDEVDAVEED